MNLCAFSKFYPSGEREPGFLIFLSDVVRYTLYCIQYIVARYSTCTVITCDHVTVCESTLRQFYLVLKEVPISYYISENARSRL
jgi:hypothetical protein